MIKILSPVSRVDEVDEVIEVGADELYCGVLPDDWREQYTVSASLNRRQEDNAVPGTSPHFRSFDELAESVRRAHARQVPVFLTLNEHYYTQDQYPHLLSYIDRACAAEVTNTNSALPTIGASGAIAAVMGGYFRLYPHDRVEMVIPPFFLGPLFVVPAVMFLGWWFILQFFNGTLSLLSDPSRAGGVAWWAHIGGFVFGTLLCSVIKVKRFYRRRYEMKTCHGEGLHGRSLTR